MRAAVALAVALVVSVALAFSVPADPALAGEDSSATSATTAEGPAVDRDIIPRPDSGTEPESPGDRGGWAQLLVLVALVGGLAVLGGLAYRSSRRARTDLTDRTR